MAMRVTYGVGAMVVGVVAALHYLANGIQPSATFRCTICGEATNPYKSAQAVPPTILR
jgi:hypothetical protein